MPKQLKAQRPLPLEAILTFARALATKHAHRPDDIDDLVQVGLMAYHKQISKSPRQRITNPSAFAGTILIRAMKGFYFYSYPKKGIFRPTREQEWKRCGEITEVLETHTTGDSQEELFELADYFAALERECGKTARVLAENLVLVSNPCVAGYILGEAARKSEVRAQAKNLPKRARLRLPRGGGSPGYSIPITPRRIGDAMGLNSRECAKEMQRIREFTATYYNMNVDTVSPLSRTA